jgi:hypothetical protein
MNDESTERDAGDGDRETVQASYDWETTTPSQAVVEAIAIATNREPTDLEPLYDSVDPDALDGLFEGPAVPADLTLSFTHAGCEIVLRERGGLVVEPVESE